MKNPCHFASAILIIIASLGVTASIPGTAFSDSVVAGTITSVAGEKMAGVTVSARREGSTITTSVFTDETGNYYFPPLPNGKYQIWAQALTYQTANAKSEVKEKSTQHDFVMQPMKNQEDWIRQFPGDEFLAALPGDTPEDYRMKTQVRKNCTGCHTASYPLQFRFDEQGWNKILNLMKHTLTYSVCIKARITNRRRISNFTRRNSQPISLARAAQARPL